MPHVLVISCLLCLLFVQRLRGNELPSLGSNDCVVIIGGGDAAALQNFGYLDVLLAISCPGVRVKNLAWEGDTVFEQKRDYGYPSLIESVRKSEATVVFAFFGRMESLSGAGKLASFQNSYGELLAKIKDLKVVLFSPLPFEEAKPPLPDSRKYNPQLKLYVEAVQNIARQNKLSFCPLPEAGGRWTSDGVQLNAAGVYGFSQAIAACLGLNISNPGPVDLEGKWTDPNLESLRILAMQKNRLWFNYSRPQNWAFLGGDRTTQPSSRDHNDPKVRWFPAEMEQYVPLLQLKETELMEGARRWKAQ